MSIQELYINQASAFAKYAYSLAQNEKEAEDLVHTTFLKALENACYLESLSTSQTQAWLYKTLKNQFIDQYRKQKKWILTDDFSSFDAMLSHSGSFSVVDFKSIMEVLSHEERAIFSLRYIQGYSSAEIAKLKGINPSTLRSRFSVIHQKIKDDL